MREARRLGWSESTSSGLGFPLERYITSSGVRWQPRGSGGGIIHSGLHSALNAVLRSDLQFVAA